MELSPAKELYTKPIHPYTEALLGAIPIPDPEENRGAPASRHRRRAPEPDQPAPGLPLPHALPARDRRLLGRSSRRWPSTRAATSRPATIR